MGMSADALQGFQQGEPSANGAGASGGSTEGAQPQGQGTGAQQPDYSLAGDFLQRVPPEHRPILEPYVKQWDAGVTRRFQELHGRLQPWEQLGADPETVQQALQVFELLDSNPQMLYEFLQQELGLSPQQAAQQVVQQQGYPASPSQGYPQVPQPSQYPQQQTYGGQQNQLGQVQGLPPEFQQKFETFERTLQALAEHTLMQHQAQQQAQEDSQLDQYLNQLRQEFGDFDEDYVLVKMHQGMDGGAAVQEYLGLVQQAMNQAGRSGQSVQLPTLSGTGAAPQEPQTVTKLKSNDVKSIVANLLEQVNSQGQ